MKNMKKHVCSFCARPFARAEHKLRHERSHTKEKPFHCKLCPSSFVRRDLLQRHLRTLHKGVDTEADDMVLSSLSDGFSSTSNIPAENDASASVQKPPEMKQNVSNNIVNLLSISNKLPNLNTINQLSQYFIIFSTDGYTESEISNAINSNQFVLLYSYLIRSAVKCNCFNDASILISRVHSILNSSLLVSDKSHCRLKSLQIVLEAYLNNYSNLNTTFELPLISDIYLKLYNEFTSSISEVDELSEIHWCCFITLSQYNSINNDINVGKPLNSLIETKLLSNQSTSKVVQLLSKSYKLQIGLSVSNIQLLTSIMSNELSTPTILKSKDFIHNSIIMLNKLLSKTHKLNSFQSITKQYLLINSPQHFNELLAEYIFFPEFQHHWELLSLTLKEFTNNIQFKLINSFDFKSYLQLIPTSTINNNVGLVLIPVLVLSASTNQPVYNDLSKAIIVESLLVLIKIFNELTQQTLSNPIIESIIYILKQTINNTSINTSNASTPQDLLTLKQNLIQSTTVVLNNYLNSFNLDQLTKSNIQLTITNFYSLTSPLPSIQNSPTLSSSSFIRLPPLQIQSQDTQAPVLHKANANSIELYKYCM